MELNAFSNIDQYIFEFDFEDGTHKIVDIAPLVQSKVSLEDIKSAHIDSEWGCLEFNDGMIDIDPKTLYSFVLKAS
ncbi:MAG: DUF2442 domain-containing protein [Campylobacterota bacterium]|nr:DUF2442 domain-containing protein [Campylobacterota bacterium]